jgi:hypothetical protein
MAAHVMHVHANATNTPSGRPRQVQTSLVLQVLLYFGGWWDTIFWVLSVALFIYKGP